MKIRSIRLLMVLLFGAAAFPSTAQNITGIWRGYFISQGIEQYKFELQVEQKGNNTLTGVTYSYLDTRFYGKATLTGFFNTGSNSALVQETKTVELRMGVGSSACIMKCRFDYVKSGNEEFLEGTFTSAYEKSDPRHGIKKGENCGGGRVYLRKVETSDFYVEPFLREKPTVRKPVPQSAPTKIDVPATDKPVAKTTPKTTPARTTPARTPGAKTPANTSPPVAKTRTPDRPKTDSIKKIQPPVVIQQTPKERTPKPVFTLPKETRSRNNELTETVVVRNEEVQVRLYDNGEIDGDTISVYLDNRLILSKKGLTTAPLVLSVKLNEENPEHTLVMVAENMGRIPPNTSLMIVYDGDKRYQVRITSTDQKNAMVRFRYQPSE